jgi:hypothetical protein
MSCASWARLATLVPFITAMRTSVVWGDGVDVASPVGEDVSVGEGELVCVGGVGESVGAGLAPVDSSNPLMRTTTPAATKATMITIRDVPRFTGPSYRTPADLRP